MNEKALPILIRYHADIPMIAKKEKGCIVLQSTCSGVQPIRQKDFLPK